MAAAPDFLSSDNSQPPSLMQSPGPLSLSQLDTSHVVARRGKLEPLSRPKERKPRRKTKSKATETRDNAESIVEGRSAPEHGPVSSERVSSLNEDPLVSIRARLDPFYPPQSAVASEPLEVGLPTTAAETGSEPATNLKKKKRRRKKEADKVDQPQGGSALVTVSADVEPPASPTAALPRDDPQADGESSPTLSESVVAGSQAVREPVGNLKPIKRKNRQPRLEQAREEPHQSAPTPVVPSPSPLPPQDVHVTVNTTPVQFEPPSEIERAAHSFTPTREQSERESYSRPQSETSLVGGSRVPQVFQGAPTSPVGPTPPEQETAPRWPVPPEDIIERAPAQEPVTATAALFVTRGGAGELDALGAEGQSQDVVYLERRDGKGFIAQKRRPESVGTSRDTDLEAASTHRNMLSSAMVSKGTHSGIQRIGLALFGLLAGLSLLDMVMVFVLSQQVLGQAGLLQFYSPASLPLLSVYVVLFLVVFISVLDRVDPSHWSKECLGSYCQSPKQILVSAAVGLLLLAMVATFSVAFIHEQISLYPQFPGLWLDLLAESNTTAAAEPPSLVTHTLDNTVYFFSGRSSVTVTVWQAMAVVRAVCCLAAWLVIACLNDYDRLDDYLREKEEEGRKCTQ